MKGRFESGVAARILLICSIVVLLISVQSASARQIAGVSVPESVEVRNQTLVLNGAGIRKKLFLKIYVGALYLTEEHTTVDEILTDTGAKRIVMDILHWKLSVKDQVDARIKGFKKNNSAEELKELQDRISQFNSLFDPVRKGDVVRLDYLPEEGTQVWINGTLKGTVLGEDFARALLKLWLGPKPADEVLKKAWLGG